MKILEEPQDTLTQEQAISKFREFIPNFKSEGQQKYFEMIFARKAQNKFYLEIELADLNGFSNELSCSLKYEPSKYITELENELKSYAKSIAQVDEMWQIQITSDENPSKLRALRSSQLNQLVTIQGIVTQISQPYQKTKVMSLQCKNCGNNLKLYQGEGLEIEQIPRICQRQNMDPQAQGSEECPKDPYIIVPEECEIIDQQFCRIQELNENIPTGEIPRTFNVSLDKYLIDRVVPGQTITISGVYKIMQKKQVNNKGMPTGLKLPYIQALGIKKLQSKQRYHFTNQEITDFKNYAKMPNFFEKISQNIAPQIYGHETVKQVITCQLFGGSKKVLPDKTRLRGDINVLLIGDPSTGKSQFLKFIEKISPVSVYTSGKGSSAAGLTASVVRNFSTGEFSIEGGAMVLADGGIVCIDEFDKMRAEDRVAIHEAMEQQTISVSKAGFTTKLNSRCSVLAAANPIFGSYSEGKDISEQIELQTTILSRFDSIFIIRDPKNREHDSKIVDHILNIHSNQQDDQNKQNDNLDIKLFQRYISYAKTHIDPRLSPQASEAIVNLYVNDREKAKEQGNSKSKKHHIPITVRQLEALIRLSESIAKLHLSETVTTQHIEYAHKLFTESTMNAIGGGGDAIGITQDAQTMQLVQKIEQAVKGLINIGGRKKTSDVRRTLSSLYKNEQAIDYAISNLIKSDQFKFISGNHGLQRVR
ncbi:P-loop containing nucleoside triphosphate hydrolase [Pseudocohnilembus persalinus]|uniref:DNA replication licensing factor MCM5 n=1 Tax=Pseudocohnilembus persalinus TaxID=266149 RepID=A0A0V0R6T9_PSEPJ|nr:P-loop containing nucleoside triphosphate hydrolase [Pseudocohnilembus persalinus]|eukprot:KRX10080.1 P-loop containing nucleoside triphosphate hydrolase [Pseudocohnilembus persalinus]